MIFIELFFSFNFNLNCERKEKKIMRLWNICEIDFGDLVGKFVFLDFFSLFFFLSLFPFSLFSLFLFFFEKILKIFNFSKRKKKNFSFELLVVLV